VDRAERPRCAPGVKENVRSNSPTQQSATAASNRHAASCPATAPLPRPIDDGGARAMETARCRDIYNRIRPHQALDDRTPGRPTSIVTQPPTEGLWGARSRSWAADQR
jgi:hypothetical protein